VPANSHHYTEKLHATYGPLVQISPEMVAVSDHNEIRRIYVTDDLPKSHLIYNNFRQDKDRPTLLTFTDKKAYGVRKRMVSSMFGIRYIRGMQSIMRQCVDVALKRLDDLCAQEPSGVAVVDICNLVQSLAVDIIGDTTFGQSFHVVENGSHPLPLKLKQALMMSGLFQFIPWLKAVPGIPLRPAYIGQFTNEIVQNRRAVIASAPRTDLLQMLVEAVDDAPSSTFRSSDLQDEVVVLLTAGSETTANAELFVILLLTKHPEKMTKLQAEIDRFYPNAELETNADHMPEMHYLQACIDETMRLYPAQPTGSPRESPQDISVLGYEIPRGTAIFPTTATVQRDSALWDQPDAFIPERWLDSVTASRITPVSFYPFAAGSRVCIGRHFALQEMYLSLVGLFRRFEFRYIKGQDEVTMLRVAQQLRAGKYMVEVKRRS